MTTNYSFAAQSNGKNGVYGMVSGFVAKDLQLGTTPTGKNFAKFSLPLENTGKKITGLFGGEKAPETLWLQVTTWEADKSNLYSRVSKGIKKGERVSVQGFIKASEYNGKTYYDMALVDFSVLYTQEKGAYAVGGEYTYINAVAGAKEGTAVGGLTGYIATEPEITEVAGIKALKFSVIVNKIGSKLNYPLGLQGKSEDKVFIGVTFFEPKTFERVDKVATVLHKGSAVGLFGNFMSTTGAEGKVYYNMTLRDFELLNVKKTDASGQEAPHPADGPEPDFGDVFAGSTLDIANDDLPF